MYHGPWGKKGIIQQIPGTKRNYTAKNISGGRVCTMAHAKGYEATFMGDRKKWNRSMAYLYGKALEYKRANPPTAEDFRFARSMAIVLGEAAPSSS